jgi:hypothetical protein
MSEHSDIDAPLDPPERELAGRLAAQRALPRAEFRGALSRHLAARDPGYVPRPERLRAIVALYAGAGVAVAGVGTLVSVGVL